jgi:hypothetical protein
MLNFGVTEFTIEYFFINLRTHIYKKWLILLKNFLNKNILNNVIWQFWCY